MMCADMLTIMFRLILFMNLLILTLYFIRLWKCLFIEYFFLYFLGKQKKNLHFEDFYLLDQQQY